MYNENNKEGKKINRRKTRYKTQVITFDKSELDELRQERQDVSKDSIGMSNVSVDVFLNSNFTEKNKSLIEPKNGNYQSYRCGDTKKKTSSTNDLCLNDNIIKTVSSSFEKKSSASSSCPDRMFSFTELVSVFNNLEKRELYPKTKHDYSYKKQKLEGSTENNCILEEQNIIHIRLQEEIIPSLKDNPFIRADKRKF